MGSRIRKKSIAHVIEEIEYLQKFNKDSLILFADDNLFVDKKYARELLKALIPLKIKYFAQTDISIAEDDELLRLAYLSGCHIAFIGFESLRPDSLGEINRNQVENEAGGKICRKHQKNSGEWNCGIRGFCSRISK